MAVVEEPIVTQTRAPFVQWSAVIAGAVTAAAISSVLLAFAGAAGLSLVSSAPSWRDTSFTLGLLAGLVLVLIALLAFGLGGYVTGRLRARSLVVTVDELQFRDGIHGLLAWGLAILFATFLAALAIHAAAPVAAPAASSASASPTGDNLLAYEVDRLFRTTRTNPVADMDYDRAQASRILLKASGHTGVSDDDRLYLTDLVSARTGAPEQDAEARVNQAIAGASDALSKARKMAVLEAFMSAAALLIGAAAAWFGAHAGGDDREKDVAPWCSVSRRHRLA